MGTELKISLLSETEFGLYKDIWDDLLDKSDLNSYFLKWEWLYSSWEAIQCTNFWKCELKIYTFKEGTKLVGLLPLYLFKSALNKILIRKIQFLGSDVGSDHMDLICLPEYQEECCRLFYHEVLLKGKNEFDKIEFQSLRENSYLLDYLKKKEKTYILEDMVCPRVILPNSYTDYLKRYNSRQRNRIKNRAKKIYKNFESVEVEFDASGNKSYLFNILFDLHKNRSDVIRSGRSSFYNDYRRGFNTSLFNNCEDKNILFSVVKINGEIVSILYMLVYKGNLHYYQNGWLSKYAGYSINFFHLYEVIKYAIEKGYSIFDLLRGDEPYKNRLKGEKYMTYTFICFSSSFIGTLHKWLFFNFRRMKSVIKKCLMMT